jgi:ABC-type branched-subunit amino acid transport system ATPase component
MARAVMAKPKLLILDEPMAGVNILLIRQLVSHIRSLRDQGITFLLVEHNLDVVAELCDLVFVMAEGRTIAQGSMAELRKDRSVIEAYLGAAHT